MTLKAFIYFLLHGCKIKISLIGLYSQQSQSKIYFVIKTLTLRNPPSPRTRKNRFCQSFPPWAVNINCEQLQSVHRMLGVLLLLLLLLLLRHEFPPPFTTWIWGFVDLWICGFMDLRIYFVIKTLTLRNPPSPRTRKNRFCQSFPPWAVNINCEQLQSVHRMLGVLLLLLLLLLLRHEFPPPFTTWIWGFVDLWICGFMDLRICGFLALWLCGFVDLWVRGFVGP